MVEQLDRSEVQDEKYVIAPVLKALQVLLLLADHGEVTLKEVYVELGVSKAQAFRYLTTLRVCGFVDYDSETSLFRLGLRSWDLGRAASGYSKLLELATPFMEELRDRFNETVNLGILKGAKIIYLGVVESRHSLRMLATIGGSDPVYSTSIGKAILAFLPEERWDGILPTHLAPRTAHTVTSRVALRDNLRLTRTRGYAIDEGENEAGACCVGAPLFDRYGRVVAAISLSAPATRLAGEFLREATSAVMETSLAISQRLKA